MSVSHTLKLASRLESIKALLQILGGTQRLRAHSHAHTHIVAILVHKSMGKTSMTNRQGRAGEDLPFVTQAHDNCVLKPFDKCFKTLKKPLKIELLPLKTQKTYQKLNSALRISVLNLYMAPIRYYCC